MCPLQHVSRMEELEPPMGTAQAERAVGGEGMGKADVQDIFVVVGRLFGW
jgi:hypothetical protein